jgi:hypothetical protein
MKTTLKVLSVLLALPLAVAIGCSSSPPAYQLDGVVSAPDKAGKADLVGELFNCKSSCTCQSGNSFSIQYASCAASDAEAVQDIPQACDRLCITLEGTSPASGWGTTTECTPGNQVCGYVSPIGGTDLSEPYPVDLAYYEPSVDLSYSEPDLGI